MSLIKIALWAPSLITLTQYAQLRSLIVWRREWLHAHWRAFPTLLFLVFIAFLIAMHLLLLIDYSRCSAQRSLHITTLPDFTHHYESGPAPDFRLSQVLHSFFLAGFSSPWWSLVSSRSGIIARASFWITVRRRKHTSPVHLRSSHKLLDL